VDVLLWLNTVIEFGAGVGIWLLPQLVPPPIGPELMDAASNDVALLLSALVGSCLITLSILSGIAILGGCRNLTCRVSFFPRISIPLRVWWMLCYVMLLFLPQGENTRSMFYTIQRRSSTSPTSNTHWPLSIP